MAAEDDLKRLLAMIPGGASLDAKLNDFANYIKMKARAGAEEAIPTITAKVKAEAENVIEPYVKAGLALSGAALLLSLAAFLSTRKQAHTKALSGARSLR